MKIAIAELLAAMDMAAAKALGQQQPDPQYAGFNLNRKAPKEGAALVLSGNTVIVNPQILQADNAKVDMQITVKQRNNEGETSRLLATQLSFIKIPISNLFAGNTEQDFAFMAYSAN